VQNRKASHFDPVLRDVFLLPGELSALPDKTRSCMSRSRVALFPHNIPGGTSIRPTATQSERRRTRTLSAARMRARLSPC